MRPLLAALLVGSIGLYFAFGRNHATAPAAAEADTPAAKLKAVQKGFGKGVDELQERLAAAKTPAAESGIRAEARELAAITAGKVLAVADESPKDPAVVDAAAFALGTLTRFGADGADLDKLVGLVADHHLGDPRVKDLLGLAAQVGPAGEKLLTAAAEKAPAKEARAVARYHLGTLTGEKGDGEADEAKAAALYAKAVEYLEKAAKEAPDAAVGEGKLGPAAAGEAAAYKTLVVGKPAPEVEVADLDGKTVKLSDYKGKVVLLDIWATWCGPCRAMIPHSRELVEKYKGRPFVLVGASADEDKDDVVKFKEKVAMPWVHWFDGAKGPVSKAFRVKAFPTLYLIDAQGVIRKRWIGVPGGDPKSPVVDEAVDKLLKEVG